MPEPTSVRDITKLPAMLEIKHGGLESSKGPLRKKVFQPFCKGLRSSRRCSIRLDEMLAVNLSILSNSPPHSDLT
jgi:hypothetical protein